jgi:hypothetical protein
MQLDETFVADTGLTVPPGPLPVDFRASLDRALDNIIAPGKDGGFLMLMDKDPAGKPRVTVGVATKVFENEKASWLVGADFMAALNGDRQGRLFVRGTWVW